MCDLTPKAPKTLLQPSAAVLQRMAGWFISALVGPSYWHGAGDWLIHHHHQNVFTEVPRPCSEAESEPLGIPPPPGHLFLFVPYFKIIARTNHGNPAVLGRQSTRLGSCSGVAAVLNRTFYLIACRHRATAPKHQTTTPSWGCWRRVGVSKPRFDLFHSKPTRNKLRRKKGPALGGVSGE